MAINEVQLFIENDALIVICTFVVIIVLISISLVARIRRHSDIL